MNGKRRFLTAKGLVAIAAVGCSLVFGVPGAAAAQNTYACELQLFGSRITSSPSGQPSAWEPGGRGRWYSNTGNLECVGTSGSQVAGLPGHASGVPIGSGTYDGGLLGGAEWGWFHGTGSIRLAGRYYSGVNWVIDVRGTTAVVSLYTNDGRVSGLGTAVYDSCVHNSGCYSFMIVGSLELQVS